IPCNTETESALVFDDTSFSGTMQISPKPPQSPLQTADEGESPSDPIQSLAPPEKSSGFCKAPDPIGTVKFTTADFSASLMPVRAFGSVKLTRALAWLCAPARSAGLCWRPKCITIAVWPAGTVISHR